MTPAEEWSKHFDAVFCIHYLPQHRKLGRLQMELKRVGLAESGVLVMRYTTPSPYDGVIFNSLGVARIAINPGCVNLGLETLRIMRESLDRGFGRILVLENDIAFLKDVGEIAETLAMMPDRNLVQFDKFITPDGSKEYEHRIRECRINERFFDPEGVTYYSGACFAVDRVAMERIVGAMEGRLGPCPADSLFAILGLSRAVAVMNTAIQLVYGGSISANAWGIMSHHEGYLRGGVDYAKYELPVGYGVGSAL